MTRKLIPLGLLSTTAVLLTACGAGANNAPATQAQSGAPVEAPAEVYVPEGGLTGTLRIASFTNEAQIHALAFQELHPELNIEFQFVSMDGGEYQAWITPIMAGIGQPFDIIYMETDFARSFIENDGWFYDLSAFITPHINAAGTFPASVQLGRVDDEIRALSYQLTPGAMFFRRSMALEYFGTDDPAVLQGYFSDWDTALDSARRIRDLSGGSTFFVSGPADLWRPFQPNRSQPWVVDNALHIDDVAIQWMTTSNTLRQEGLDAEVGQWSGEWFAGMSDTLTNAAGEPIRTFSYFAPTWWLPFVLGNNGGGTLGDLDAGVYGDWGIIPGPMPFQWGGTWLGVPQASANSEAALEFVRFITTDMAFLTDWALGRYTNEHLQSIDASASPTIVPGGDLSQPAGDLISSSVLVNSLGDYFYGTFASNVVAGQNPFTFFGSPEVAGSVTFGVAQGTDATIGDAFIDANDLFITGQATLEEALDSFRSSVQTALPGITVN